MFQIDQKTKECSKIALTEVWDPFNIPDNSTFEDQYFIGGPGDNVEVQEWSDRKPARKREFFSFFSLSGKSGKVYRSPEFWSLTSYFHIKNLALLSFFPAELHSSDFTRLFLCRFVILC